MKNLIVTVNGVAYNVTVEEGTGAPAAAAAPVAAPAAAPEWSSYLFQSRTRP